MSKILKLSLATTLSLLFALAASLMFASPASAQVTPPTPTIPGDSAGIDISVPDLTNGGGSNVVVIILVLTVLSIAPAIIVLMTSFTRIVITFSLARQALGAPQVPPNQVVVGLALLLSLVVMAPTFNKIQDQALKPLLDEKITVTQAIDRAEEPMREFLLKNTRDEELSAMRSIAGEDPESAASKTGFIPLVTAFVLSELRTAFTLGFLIFIPFLIIDLIVSSVLMSLGLMFLPPTFVSLPLKLLLFVLLGGWTLIAETVVRSFA